MRPAFATTFVTVFATAAAAFGSLLMSSCASVPPKSRKPPFTAQRPLSSLLEVSAYPNADTRVLLVTMQQLMSSHREWDGYRHFGRLAEEQPQRRTQLLALQATMQARVAQDVPLLRRIAWVKDAIAKLDAGVAADPRLGRLGRGLVFAELPARFGKTQQAVDDLEFCLAHSDEIPFEMNRGIYRALAVAYRTLGQEARSREMLAHAGLPSLDEHVLGDISVDEQHGFRFGAPRLAREADGVYVAEGFDFANIGFIVTPTFVVAIDAGTTEETARDAVAALRKVTTAPIKYVVLTHGHWDHVGGLAAVREPGAKVIARAGFKEELERSREYHPPFRYFFGNGTMKLDAQPDHLVTAPETITEGGLDLQLLPAPSGETDDALFVQDRKHDILFVGDAFMPYLGAPFVAEGSAEGYLGAISKVLELRPRRLVHGHGPLTQFFTAQAMQGLRDALGAPYTHGLEGARAARPLVDVLHDDFLPEALRASPAAVMPYLVARDTFVQRLYLRHAGYWQSNGDGMDVFTHAEWAAAIDATGGGEPAFVRASRELESRGDAALALRMADLGLLRYPASAALQDSRRRALTTLRELHSQANPFRFIIDSEWAGSGLAPTQSPTRTQSAMSAR